MGESVPRFFAVQNCLSQSLVCSHTGHLKIFSHFHLIRINRLLIIVIELCRFFLDIFKDLLLLDLIIVDDRNISVLHVFFVRIGQFIIDVDCKAVGLELTIQ